MALVRATIKRNEMKGLTKTKRTVLTVTILYESVLFLFCFFSGIVGYDSSKDIFLFTLATFLFFSSPFILYWLGVWIYNLLGE